MKILNNITEDEVNATILQYNMGSFRFNKELKKLLKENKIDTKIVSEPNLKNINENKLRKKFIQSLDGSGIGGYLNGNFPNNVVWKKVLLTKKDINNVKYIDYSYWNELTNQTRMAKDGAKSIKKGIIIFNESNQPFWDAFEALKKGKKFPAPILVSQNTNSDLVVIDGHLRLTVYLLDTHYTPNEIEAIVGCSENFKSWDLY